jgi:hypothetical protein
MLAIWGGTRADELGSGRVSSARSRASFDALCARTIELPRWPLASLASAAGGIPAETAGPLATWREWASDVHCFAIDSGHYLAEEAPDATAKALIEFFAAT